MRVQEPAVRVGRVVEVDAAFEDGVLRYAEVAADGWHDDAVVVGEVGRVVR